MYICKANSYLHNNILSDTFNAGICIRIECFWIAFTDYYDRNSNRILIIIYTSKSTVWSNWLFNLLKFNVITDHKQFPIIRYVRDCEIIEICGQFCNIIRHDFHEQC